jgi:serine acetyltransferase
LRTRLKSKAPRATRLIADIAHEAAGADIRPDAQIGGGFFNDYGAGVVISATLSGSSAQREALSY